MTAPSDETDPASEARALVASAHALVRELVEEGVSEFERQALDEATTFEATPPEAARTEGSESARPRADASPRPPRPPSTESPSPAPVAGVADETIVWDVDHPPDLAEVETRLGDCTRCGLCSGRKSIVFGDGNPDADLMFIGEGPGEQEDLRGLPFVGPAGELLTQMIEKGIGIPRSEVYICNIVKCRPPRNRNPLPPEVSACKPFLDGQILAVRPKVIVTLGKPAASLLLGRNVPITHERGTWQEYQGIPLMPTLHPAYVLRQYTTETRRAVWQDLQAALERSRT